LTSDGPEFLTTLARFPMSKKPENIGAVPLRSGGDGPTAFRKFA